MSLSRYWDVGYVSGLLIYICILTKGCCDFRYDCVSTISGVF